MNLLDRSPGAVITLANVILYSTVLIECWMLTTGSLAFMVATMGLIISIAAFLCTWMMRLMGPEEHALDYEPQTVAAPAAAQPAPALLGRAAVLGS